MEHLHPDIITGDMREEEMPMISERERLANVSFLFLFLSQLFYCSIHAVSALLKL